MKSCKSLRGAGSTTGAKPTRITSSDSCMVRCDDFIVQWQAVRAGLGVGCVAEYMLRTDPQVRLLLVGQLHIPPLPMWLTVHREIRTSQRIRAVYDYLAGRVPQLLCESDNIRF
jgi:DNA-binding transcriptional LysR family regulator